MTDLVKFRVVADSEDDEFASLEDALKYIRDYSLNYSQPQDIHLYETKEVKLNFKVEVE